MKKLPIFVAIMLALSCMSWAQKYEYVRLKSGDTFELESGDKAELVSVSYLRFNSRSDFSFQIEDTFYDYNDGDKSNIVVGPGKIKSKSGDNLLTFAIQRATDSGSKTLAYNDSKWEFLPNSKLAAIEEAKKEEKSKVDQLEEDKKEASDKIANLEQKVEGNTLVISELEKTILNKDEQLSLIKKDIDLQKITLEGEKQLALDKVADLEKEKKNHLASILKLETKIQEEEKEISSVTKEKDLIQSKVNSLESDNHTQEVKIEELQREIVDLKATLTEYSSSNNSFLPDSNSIQYNQVLGWCWFTDTPWFYSYSNGSWYYMKSLNESIYVWNANLPNDGWMKLHG